MKQHFTSVRNAGGTTLLLLLLLQSLSPTLLLVNAQAAAAKLSLRHTAAVVSMLQLWLQRQMLQLQKAAATGWLSCVAVELSAMYMTTGHTVYMVHSMIHDHMYGCAVQENC